VLFRKKSVLVAVMRATASNFFRFAQNFPLWTAGQPFAPRR
jgi:hypothetical protein